MQSKMPEVRDQEDSAQRNQSQRWIKNVVGVILVALLLFVLFKELHESRKLLDELSNRLAITEKENKNLRKELGVTKVKVDKMMQGFPNMQKVSRFRRARNQHNQHNKTKCRAWNHCMSRFNKGVSCTMIKNCIPSPTRRKEFIHLKTINLFSKDEFRAIDKTLAEKGRFAGAQLSWNEHAPDNDRDSRITFGGKNITIFTSGTYFVYCRLRVSQNISKVIIKTGSSSVLFSSSPTFSNDGENHGVVLMFGQAEIPTNTTLYVQVQFKDWQKAQELFNNTVNKPVMERVQMMDSLFPGYFKRESEPNINNFGVLLVSG